MKLLSLTLEQFRNYGTLSLSFGDEHVQLIVGENGRGKTNILEAVGVLSLTKSFLPVDEQDLMQWGTEFYRVKGGLRSDSGEESDLEVVSQTLPRKQKACFVNGVRIPLSTMVGRLPLVIFLPQDLSLFSGPPADRRRFLDQLLCQVSPDYFLTLIEYQKILKQRNALLKHVANGSARREDLETWDGRLAEKGSFLTLRRLELIETMNLTLGDEVRSLGEHWREVCVRYLRGTAERDSTALFEEMKAVLRQNAERDVLLQSTTVGPHRDDWQIEADGHLLSTFASRGQQRVAVLALLFLESSYVELRRGEKPVILLDDIFSELDEEHRHRVMESFSGHQVLMTTTHLPEETLEGVRVWRMEEMTERLAVSD